MKTIVISMNLRGRPLGSYMKDVLFDVFSDWIKPLTLFYEDSPTRLILHWNLEISFVH